MFKCCQFLPLFLSQFCFNSLFCLWQPKKPFFAIRKVKRIISKVFTTRQVKFSKQFDLNLGLMICVWGGGGMIPPSYNITPPFREPQLEITSCGRSGQIYSGPYTQPNQSGFRVPHQGPFAAVKRANRQILKIIHSKT